MDDKTKLRLAVRTLEYISRILQTEDKWTIDVLLDIRAGTDSTLKKLQSPVFLPIVDLESAQAKQSFALLQAIERLEKPPEED